MGQIKTVSVEVMMNKLFLSIFILYFIVGCSSLKSQPIQLEDWNISTVDDLKDSEVNALDLLNLHDNSQVSIATLKGKIAAVSVFVEDEENVGIQYRKDFPNRIEHIRITDSKDISKPIIKIYKNQNGKWAIGKFKSGSDKYPIKSVLLDFD